MDTNVNAYRDIEIPTDPKLGGALNWFDKCDSEHQVHLIIFGAKAPTSSAAFEKWLIQSLRDVMHQTFYFYLNTHKGMPLKAEVVASQQTGWPEYTNTVLRMPLAQIFGLPNVDPATELAQMREFLTFIDERGRGQREGGHDALLQWYRSGYRNRGLDWVGFEDKAVGKACMAELEERLKTPWLAQWKQSQLNNLGRIRNGPHCWFSMPSLVPDRWWAAEMEKFHEESKRARPKTP